MGRGALVFKGDSPKKKKSKKKHDKKRLLEKTEEGLSTVAQETTAMPVPARPSAPSVPVKDPQKLLKEGTGHITTSGTVVTGYGTRFEKELSSSGDAMVVMVGGQQEMRVVTMRLSQVSCALSSAFSVNLKSPTRFQIISKPRDVQKEARIASQKATLDQKEEEEKAFGTYGATDELVYREKTDHGGYRIKRVKVEGSQSIGRGDLLSMRTKKKSDKYC